MRASFPFPALLPTDHTGARPFAEGSRAPGEMTPRPVLALVVRLCQALEREAISYCHWKSTNALDRSAAGDNDLDLLISRTDASRFTELLWRLGFKQAQTPAEKQAPGVLDFFGYDEPAGKLVHVHVHYQLSLGHDLTKNYRLPIEEAYLRSSAQGDLFRVPAPEWEFIVLVVRLILKHATWDVMLWGEGGLTESARRELAYLSARIDPTRVGELVQRHLPYIGDALFRECVRALQPGRAAGARLRAGYQLQQALQANAQRPMLHDTARKVWRRAWLAIRYRVGKGAPKYRLQPGLTVALAGGDGAGKSTAVDAVYHRLGPTFAVTRVHMGKPAWSPVTMTIRSILKTGQLLGLYPIESSFRETLTQQSRVSPGYPWLVREVCRARDRYWTFVKARRYAAGGGIVLFDRFPLPEVRLMDGPQCARFAGQLPAHAPGGALFQPQPRSRWTMGLIRLEQRYYQRIAPPDLLIVLRVEPRIAVQRKPDEDAGSVRERSTEIWEAAWERTAAQVIDAAQSREAVASEITARIWSLL